MFTNQIPTTGFVREAQLVGARGGDKSGAILPVSHTTLWAWIRAGKFPKPVKLSANVTAWRAAEVQAWLAAH